MDREGSGLGVERQRDDCLELAQARGWTVVETFADNDISAFSGKRRPGYVALLDYMRAGGCDRVIAWHVDRLHRSPVELEEFIAVSEAANVTTVTVKAGELDLATAAGRMVARMLGAAARHESEQKSERIKRKRRQDAQAGKAHGPLGYGYDEQQKVVASEAEVIREVASRLLSGDTLYGLALDLNGRGVPSPGAGRWYHHHVSAIANTVSNGVRGDHRWVLDIDERVRELVIALADRVATSSDDSRRLAKVAGTSTARTALRSGLVATDRPGPGQIAKLLTAAHIPAPTTAWRAANLRSMIRRGTLCGWRDFGPGGRGGGSMVAKGTWEPILDEEVSIRLRRLLDAPSRKRTGRERRLLLSSVLVCGRCGAPLSGTTTPRDGRRYTCAQQPGLSRCGRLTVVADPVDELVVEAVLSVIESSQVVEQQAASEERRLASAERDLEEIRELRAAFVTDVAEGRISREEWFVLRDGLESREERARANLRTTRIPARTVRSIVPDLEGAELRAWWAGLDLKMQREVIRLLIERVVIHPSSGPTRRFDPNRVAVPVWRA